MAGGALAGLQLAGGAAAPGSPTRRRVAELARASARASAAPAAGAGREHVALYRGPWRGLVHERLIEHGARAVHGPGFFIGWETLAYMLFGMAALKIRLPPRRLGARRAIANGRWSASPSRIPAYALARLAADPRRLLGADAVHLRRSAATTPFRPLMIVAIAALDHPARPARGGWLVDADRGGRAAPPSPIISARRS